MQGRNVTALSALAMNQGWMKSVGKPLRTDSGTVPVWKLVNIFLVRTSRNIRRPKS